MVQAAIKATKVDERQSQYNPGYGEYQYLNSLKSLESTSDSNPTIANKTATQGAAATLSSGQLPDELVLGSLAFKLAADAKYGKPAERQDETYHDW